MIDLHLLRDEQEKVKALLLKKNPTFPINELIDLDKQVRTIQITIEDIRREKNELAQQAKKGVTPQIRERSIQLSKQFKEKAVLFEELKARFEQLYLSCPNIPAEDIPSGGSDQNCVVKIVGEKPTFNFPVKHHIELGVAGDWLDFETAAKMTGSQFVVYKGEAVKLLYALTMFMLKHNMQYGYELLLPPYLVNAESLTVASNFPKFKDQVYGIENEDLYLTPTSEVELANVYRDHIFFCDDLPRRMTCWTSCFRREAGGYGATERGLIRMHQFEKVELYTICEPDKSNEEQDRMLECAQRLLSKLELPYRVVLLAAQECSFASAKTYDIEIWLPGQEGYYEVSSISNCTDFQARRGAIRYKKTEGKGTMLVHTLNGSSLALARLMVAIMEIYQQEDGRIAIPEVLKHEALF